MRLNNRVNLSALACIGLLLSCTGCDKSDTPACESISPATPEAAPPKPVDIAAASATPTAPTAPSTPADGNPYFIRSRSGSQSRAAIRAPADEIRGKSFFWKVTADDGSFVYLLGSVHVANKGMYPLPKVIEDAFAACPNLVVEVNEDAVDQVKLMQTVVERGMYKAGDTITKHLSEKGNKALKEFDAKSGLPLGYQMMKPWLVAVTITLTELQKLGFDPSLGIDKHFMAAAKKADKKVLELESVEFQLGVMSGFSDELQEKFLISTILEISTIKTEFDKMIQAWKDGDVENMEKMLFRQLKEEPELKPVYDKLFFERNAGMAGKIEGYLKSRQPHFVVMGAGHLVGDKGIVKLLTDKKYKMEQVGTR